MSAPGQLEHRPRVGMPLAMRWVSVIWYHDGKMTRLARDLTGHEALSAVGLTE
ncbi:MAG TPA: hypothetical protein VGO14_01275 [Solirubrobacteraceae bacterium]|jgi:hypothetical protein|nr:hypothetical protein [Solirubrobacteraceae bacterium]